MIINNVGKQKGFTLTEALVSFAITATGLLAIVSFQAGLFTSSANNKARTEALSLAQQKIEQFKHYTHADEDNFIDNDADGVMDADGNYSDAVIPGQNADFTRAWDLTTVGESKQIDVTVSWADAANETQSVSLSSEMPWISPRSGVDQVADLQDPIISSPTGRARHGEGNLADYDPNDISPVGSPGVDGLSTYQHKDDLLLTDSNDDVLLTLLDACTSSTCTDFVRISGTVYLDRANVANADSLEDIFVVASDAAHCERWVPTGSLASPPTTASGDYELYNYTCYLGGGWYGNIGFLTAGGLSLTDKVCQGDPTSLSVWSQPVVELRRVYRGMIHQVRAGQTYYFSQGIKDAAHLTGQDFVFTSLATSATEGTACYGADAPMTRTDSSAGQLFAGVPTDFVCLNTDADADSNPDYLDSYDTANYSASTSCPYDPSDPPVYNHEITGTVAVVTLQPDELTNFAIATSDGSGNCEWTSSFTAAAGGYQATYRCDVYNWGSGWSGYVEIEANSNFVYCPSPTANFSNVTSDQSQDFGCIASDTVVIEGAFTYGSAATINSVSISELVSGFPGVCKFTAGAYRCIIAYGGTDWDGSLDISSDKTVCDSSDGVFSFYDYTAANNPHRHDVYIAHVASHCP